MTTMMITNESQLCMLIGIAATLASQLIVALVTRTTITQQQQQQQASTTSRPASTKSTNENSALTRTTSRTTTETMTMMMTTPQRPQHGAVVAGARSCARQGDVTIHDEATLDVPLVIVEQQQNTDNDAHCLATTTAQHGIPATNSGMGPATLKKQQQQHDDESASLTTATTRTSLSSWSAGSLCSLSCGDDDASVVTHKTCSTRMKKCVKFATSACVYDMPTILGDAAVAMGPPITMAWRPLRVREMPLNDARQPQRPCTNLTLSTTTRTTATTTARATPLTPQERHVRLRRNGVTVHQIRQAIAQSQVTLQQRMDTYQRLVQKKQQRRKQRQQQQLLVSTARQQIFLDCQQQH